MITIMPYEPEHGRAVIAGTERYRWIPSFVDETKWVKGWKDAGPAFTAIEDGKILGCGGAMIYWPGRAEMWLLLGDAFYGKKFSGVKLVYGFLFTLMANHGLTRVEANVVADDGRARRFVEWIGFKEEGTMPKYLMDTTYVRYGLVR